MSKVTLSPDEAVELNRLVNPGWKYDPQYCSEIVAWVEAWGAAQVAQALRDAAEGKPVGKTEPQPMVTTGPANRGVKVAYLHGVTWPDYLRALAAEFDPHTSSDKNGDEG